MTDWALALKMLCFLIIGGVMAKALKTHFLFSALKGRVNRTARVALRIIILFLDSNFLLIGKSYGLNESETLVNLKPLHDKGASHWEAPLS
jgi:hypothetical protein